MKVRVLLGILVMTAVICLAFTGGRPVFAAPLLIEDGENVSDWSDLSGGYNIITSVGSPGSVYMQVSINRAANFSNAIEWNTAHMSHFDWSRYGSIEFDAMISSPLGQAGIRFNSGGNWNNWTGFANSADGNWHHYKFSLTDAGNPQPRNDINYMFLYMPTDQVQVYTVSIDNIQLTDELVLPVISNIHVTPSVGGAVITWTTDVSGTSVVAYGTSASYGSTATGTSGTSHSVTLTGLLQNTLYHFQVRTTGPGGEAFSTDATFSTLGNALTATYQDGLNGYAGTRDTSIDSFQPGCNDGHWDTVWVTQRDDGRLAGALVAFKELNLPPNVTIVSARLNLCSKYNNLAAPQSFAVYGLLKNWGEGTGSDWGITALTGECSWNCSASPTVWATAGALGSADQASTPDDTQTSVSANNTWLSFDVTNSMRNQYNAGVEYGFVIRPNASNCDMNFYSRESSYDCSVHPKLVVQYTSPMPIIQVKKVWSTPNTSTCAITWQSDQAGSSTVEYGPTATYGSSTTAAGTGTDHSVTLVGLTQGATYHYRVRTAAAGYTDGVSADKTFTAGSLGTATAVFQDGLNGYSGTRDAMIAQWPPNQSMNFGAMNSMYMAQRLNSGNIQTYRGLVKFTGVSLPTGAVVSSATLSLCVWHDFQYIDLGQTGPLPDNTYGAFGLLKDWGEGTGIDYGYAALTGECSWLNTSLPSTWYIAGADAEGIDRNAVADDIQPVQGGWPDGVAGILNLDVTSSFKTQLASGNAYGWVIIPMTQGTSADVMSREYTGDATVRPMLTVTYSVPVTASANIGALKQNPDGPTLVALQNKQVTAWLTDQVNSSNHYIFTEESDRSSAIRVDYVGGGVYPIGSLVNVVGTLTTVNGERRIIATGISQTFDSSGNPVILDDTQQIKPLYLSGKSSGGATKGHQGGVEGGIGLNNLGLLVKVYGNISALADWDANEGMYPIYLDDGSGADGGAVSTGSTQHFVGIRCYDFYQKVLDAGFKWDITGVLTTYVDPNGKIRPAIKVRYDSDYLQIAP